jgi:hypothetical protein
LGADVVVRSIDYVAATQTDASGQYYLDGVPEGPITVTASFDGGAQAGTGTGVLYGDGGSLFVLVDMRPVGDVHVAQ